VHTEFWSIRPMWRTHFGDIGAGWKGSGSTGGQDLSN
jgi:hypothetical protein